ncbi:hypothetical protein HG531_002489 [Fusarium graminearum]|nr:hypothetical protein HG531_002489 [Fusarium graminearum]
MGVEVEVKHERVGNFLLNQSTGQGISVLVTPLWKEAYMVTLRSDDDCHLGNLVGGEAASKEFLDFGYLLLQYMSELAFTNSISHVDQMSSRTTGSSVGDIATYNDGWAAVGEECGSLPQRRRAGSGTTKLGVHLHANVGVVLAIVLLHMATKDNLAENAVSAISRLLEALVGTTVLLGHDDEQELCVAFSASDLLMSPLNQLSGFKTQVARCFTGNKAPVLEGGGVLLEELLSSQVPATSELGFRCALAKPDSRGRQDTSLGLRKLGFEIDTILPQIRILTDLKSGSSLLDVGFAYGRAGDRDLDHRSCLVGVELEWVSLHALNEGKLHGNEATLSSVDKRKVGKSQGDIVHFLVVVIDADVLSILLKGVGAGGVTSFTKLGIECKVHDRVQLVLVWAALVLDLEFEASQLAKLLEAIR